MCCRAAAFSTHFPQVVCLRAEIRPARLVAEPGQLADEIPVYMLSPFRLFNIYTSLASTSTAYGGRHIGTGHCHDSCSGAAKRHSLPCAGRARGSLQEWSQEPLPLPQSSAPGGNIVTDRSRACLVLAFGHRGLARIGVLRSLLCWSRLMCGGDEDGDAQ